MQYALSVHVTIHLKIKYLNTEQTSDLGFLNLNLRSHHWYSGDTIWNSSASTDIVIQKNCNIMTQSFKALEWTKKIFMTGGVLRGYANNAHTFKTMQLTADLSMCQAISHWFGRSAVEIIIIKPKLTIKIIPHTINKVIIFKKKSSKNSSASTGQESKQRNLGMTSRLVLKKHQRKNREAQIWQSGLY